MQGELTSFRDALTASVERLGIPIDAKQLDLLESHYAAMVRVNESMNLTRITDPVEAAIKHYADSLAMLPWAEQAGINQATLLDIGTGAGFPAVPIAVMRPGWRITAIDGTRKKTNFLSEIAADLKRENLHVEHGHSDHWTTNEKYDLVATRAVASLLRSMQLARLFLRKNGRLVAYKTHPMAKDELQEAIHECGRLGMELEPCHVYDLELNCEKLTRALYVARCR